MSANAPTLREEMNNGPGPFRLADVDRSTRIGELLARLILATAADEAGLNPNVAVPAQQITLAAVPTAVLHVRADAGAGTLGMLELRIGQPGVVDPAPGEVVWNGPGTAVLRFNATDAFTDVDAWYTVATDTISLFERTLDQRDVP